MDSLILIFYNLLTWYKPHKNIPLIRRAHPCNLLSFDEGIYFGSLYRLFSINRNKFFRGSEFQPSAVVDQIIFWTDLKKYLLVILFCRFNFLLKSVFPLTALKPAMTESNERSLLRTISEKGLPLCVIPK